MEERDFISLGFVVSVHGLKGVVKVKTYSGRADNLSAESFIYIKKTSGDLVKLKVKNVLKQKNLFLVSFYGVESINEAIHLDKGEILKKVEELAPAAEDEYYFAELIGLKAYSLEGKFVGILSDIIETGANFVISVNRDEREFLFPFIKSVVKEVDIAGGKILLDITGYVDED